jgi:hypothetical protein
MLCLDANHYNLIFSGTKNALAILAKACAWFSRSFFTVNRFEMVYNRGNENETYIWYNQCNQF